MPSFIHRAGFALAFVVFMLPSGIANARPCWAPPVSAGISDGFRAPTCAWCPGNRGIEFGTVAGSLVRAVSTGRVTFAGTVAGTVYVVVRHADGRRVTYGNLRHEVFDVDDLVVRGQLIGRAAGPFHLGVRVGERYVDPEPFLGRLVHRPRLIPVDGARPNPAPAPRWRCAT